MEAMPSRPDSLPGCLQAAMRIKMDKIMNAAAIREADDAAAGRLAADDAGAGSGYVHETAPPVFEQISAVCDLCTGTVYQGADGSLQAERCAVSGYCELFWAERYPAMYQGLAGPVPCSPEVTCTAVVAPSGVGQVDEARVVRGGCRIERSGSSWRTDGAENWRIARLVGPEVIAEFDGHGSGREGSEREVM